MIGALGIGTLIKELIGRWWWQIPVIGALIGTIALWDHARIAKHVNAGQEKVRTNIRTANDKAVDTAATIRKKAGEPETKGIRDPYTKD